MSTLFCYSNDYYVGASAISTFRNRACRQSVLTILSPVFLSKLKVDPTDTKPMAGSSPPLNGYFEELEAGRDARAPITRIQEKVMKKLYPLAITLFILTFTSIVFA